MTNKDVVTKLGNIIKLNVGGHNFTTRLGTLTKDNPGSSKVKQWFLPEPSLKIDTQGRYYIDRDPEHFAIILEYLRTGWIPLHMGERMLELLIIETKFYDIPALLSHLIRMREMRSGIKYTSKYSMETIKVNLKQEPISTMNDVEKVKDTFKTLIIRKVMEYFRNNSEHNEAKTWIYMSSEEDQNKV